MIHRRYEIDVEGADEGAFEAALAEAMRRIKAGNLEGADRSTDSGFYFTSRSAQHAQD